MRPRQKESAVLVMTDLHYGKKTATFSPEICATKLDALGENVLRIKSLLGAYHFDELVVCMLGDMNDGTGIYATQPHHQAETNVEEQADELSDLLSKWFLKQDSHWPKIRIECVPGNHGRAGKFAHEAANWDIVAYKYLRNKLPPNVTLNIPKRNAFLRTIAIRRHKYLLYHGHEVKTFGNIPWYGMSMRTSRWNTTALAPFDAVMFGHFHTFGTWQLNRITLFASGTMISDDDWALQSLGWESANKWWMFGVSDKRPVTWSFGLEV